MRLLKISICPHCGSVRTGHYLLSDIDNAYTKAKLFRNGERVRFLTITDKRKENCYCETCNGTWYEKLKKVSVTPEEFNEYLHEREFYKEREEILSKDKKKEKPRPSKEQKVDRFLKTITFLSGTDVRRFNPYRKKDKGAK